jgi:hypothetical protein
MCLKLTWIDVSDALPAPQDVRLTRLKWKQSRGFPHHQKILMNLSKPSKRVFKHKLPFLLNFCVPDERDLRQAQGMDDCPDKYFIGTGTVKIIAYL